MEHEPVATLERHKEYLSSKEGYKLIDTMSKLTAFDAPENLVASRPASARKMPESWEELEETVADILRECGMESTRQVTLDLPRGTVDVDVLAKETVDGIVSSIVCECKNWKTSVPKAVVHSFRTVMHETGANRGYIISRAGFQAGAYEAAQATNIQLVTFEEFQERCFTKWYKKQVWAVEENLSNFNTYYEPLGRPGFNLLETDDEREAYIDVWNAYACAGLLMYHFSPWGSVGDRELVPPNLPLSVEKLKEKGLIVPDVLKYETGYREILSILEEIAIEGLAELRKVYPITRGRDAKTIHRDEYPEE
ncbi:restriction endonuclease [Agrobacterium rosae]|uniref:restriction endonuclease n=1 Tax=Agrobacterium rosae TaxID=1972867 RepID=UPI003A7FF0FE